LDRVIYEASLEVKSFLRRLWPRRREAPAFALLLSCSLTWDWWLITYRCLRSSN